MKRGMLYRGLTILLILVLLTIACGDDSGSGSGYTIKANGNTYRCSSYSWDDADLVLSGCGISNRTVTLVNPSGVAISSE